MSANFMVCRYCRGRVEWQGPLAELGQYGTKCTSCGAIDSQIPFEDIEDCDLEGCDREVDDAS